LLSPRTLPGDTTFQDKTPEGDQRDREDIASARGWRSVSTVDRRATSIGVVAEAMARYTTSVVPGARLSIYSESGHAPFFDETARFNEALVRLQDVRRANERDTGGDQLPVLTAISARSRSGRS
jgi:hypothetical protein